MSARDFDCKELEDLLEKYANAETKEDIYIKRTLENIAAQYDVADSVQLYYAKVITGAFCRVIAMMERKYAAQQAEEKNCAAVPQRNERYQNGTELAREFYNYYKQQGQVDYLEIGAALENGHKDLVNPTMKDYVARIYTFTGWKYMGQMFSPEEIGDRDPVLFAYDNIELILATFKTRDEKGEIVKQRVNIRSALRKLNEFKHATER